jgi:hypothetical protein
MSLKEKPKNKVSLKCYRKECKEKITHKWYPKKNSGHLLMCKQHFDELCFVYMPEIVGKENDLIIVKNT